KLGMNVKHMTHFSTTKDAVIFPELMKEVVRTKDLNGKEALLLEDVLLTAGMRWDDNNRFSIISADYVQIDNLEAAIIAQSYIIYDNGQVILHDGNKILMNDLLRIEKK